MHGYRDSLPCSRKCRCILGSKSTDLDTPQSGIAAAGGLSENYTGQDGDQYTTGLAIGLRMVQVAIGITVGLFGSGLIVYSFGSKKRGALFAF